MKESLKEVKQSSIALCDIALILMEQAIEGNNQDGMVGAYYAINVLMGYLKTGKKQEFNADFCKILDDSMQIALAQEANELKAAH